MGSGHGSSVQQKCELNEGQEQRVITQFHAFLSSGLQPVSRLFARRVLSEYFPP